MRQFIISQMPGKDSTILSDDEDQPTNATPAPTQKDPAKIRPVWRNGSGATSYTKYVVAPLAVGSVFFEILGKKLAYPYVRPSFLISRSTSLLQSAFYKAGYVIAYLSDIAFLVRRLSTALYRLIEPVFSAVYEAIADILGEFTTMVSSTTGSFLNGYGLGLDATYNKLATVLTSIMTVFGGLLVVLFALEAFGIAKKIQWVRPSFYIIKYLADPVYDIFRFFSYMYTSFGKVFSNFKYVFDKLIERIVPFLRPMIRQLEIGGQYVKDATVSAVVKAPFMGIVNGFRDAVTGLQKNVGLTGTIAMATGVATIAFGLKYMGYF